MFVNNHTINKKSVFLLLIFFMGCGTKGEFVKKEAPNIIQKNYDEEKTKNIILLFLIDDIETAKNFLGVVESSSAIKCSFVFSSKCLKQLKDDKTIVERIVQLKMKNQIELVSTSLYGAILPLIPEDDVFEQVFRGKKLYKDIFGNEPAGFFPPESALLRDNIKGLEFSGFLWTTYPAQLLDGVYRVSGEKKSIILFPAFKVNETDEIKDYLKENYFAFGVIESTAPPEEFIRDILKSNIRLLTPTMYIENFVVESSTQEIIPATFYKDFSIWKGDPEKEMAWDELLRAKDAIKKYRNSGKAELSKLEMAEEELYACEDKKWFENYGVDVDQKTKEESDKWFRAYISNIYRIIGFSVPSEISLPLYSADGLIKEKDEQRSGYKVYFDDIMGDAETIDILSFGVKEGSGNISFDIKVSSLAISDHFKIEIYIDLNNRVGLGFSKLLFSDIVYTLPSDAWEYSFIGDLTGGDLRSDFSGTFSLYKTGIAEKPEIAEKFQSKFFSRRPNGETSRKDGHVVSFTVPKSIIRGNPQNWGYIVVATVDENISDILLEDEKRQTEIIDDLKNGKTVEIPSIRIR